MVGTTLGHYRIEEALGQGGMGVVYKARDLRLARFVAIKVLPPDAMADASRRRRFVQEAQAASALNHPNIVTIHDIDSDHGVDYIAMELVDGETLQQIIGHAPLSLERTLDYATHIADALAAAHRAGIVHRDLKPGNIMVVGGRVKVVDFGLAKLSEPLSGEIEGVPPATQTALTTQGLVVGTASYMSPEQAQGRSVDARSDLFSFSCVLYELLTGRQAFSEASTLATLAAVLHTEPKPLGDDVPEGWRRLVARGLQKDPARRFQSVTEMQAALEEIQKAGKAAPVPARARTSRNRVAVAGGVILLVVGVAAAGLWSWSRRGAAPGTQPAAAEAAALTPVVLTSYDGFEYSPSLSPDGTQVAFGWSPDGNADIYVKQVGVEDPYRLTKDPGRDLFPAWSPDGTTIAYYHFATDERIELSMMPQRGGAPVVVTELNTPAAAVDDLGAGMIVWTRDSKNMIVSASEQPRKTCALYWVSVTTGEKRRITSPPASVSGDINPALSADGRTLVFVRVRTEALTDLMRIDLDAEGRPSGDAVKLPAPYTITRAVSWTPDGTEILFDSGKSLSGGEIFRMKPLPGAVPVLLKTLGEGVFGATASAQNHRLVYASHKNDANIWRLDLAGTNVRPPRRVVASTRNDSEPSFSPDGTRLAFASSRSGTPEIWLCDANGSNMTKLTSFGGPSTHRPRWSPDGKYIAFYSDETGNREIYVSTPQGRVHRLTNHPSRDTNAEWSRDGSWIYFISDRGGRSEMWKAPSDGSGQPVRVDGVVDTVLESPDGKWLYHSRGWPDAFSVWRSPAQGPGEAVQVADGLNSVGGWRLAGDGIIYIGKVGEDGMYPLQFKNLTTRKIRTLTRILRPYWGISVTADGRSILYPQLDQSGSDLMLVENFK